MRHGLVAVIALFLGVGRAEAAGYSGDFLASKMTATSSVTASGFFGDGSQLTGIVGETNTFSSSKTFTSNVLGKSSVTASGFFGSGSALTGIARSSATTIPNTVFTNTSFALAAATVTLVTRGFPVMVSLAGTAKNSASNNTESATVFVDGAFFVEIGTRAVSSAEGAQGDTPVNMSFSVLLSGLSAGSHTFAVCFKTDGATGTFLFDASNYNQFLVREIP